MMQANLHFHPHIFFTAGKPLWLRQREARVAFLQRKSDVLASIYR
ncbi:MAG: hypothetical protein ACM3WS_04060 [Bacillota bacterium]